MLELFTDTGMGSDAYSVIELKMIEGKGGYQDSSFYRLPEVLTEDFFYAMGLLWSDGNLGDRGYWLYDQNNLKTKRANALGFVNTCVGAILMVVFRRCEVR